jgi:peptidoglycan-associated lipoprotein
MKINQIIFPLALALAVTLATTSCKHGPTGITPIPDNHSQVGNDQNPNTIPSTPPINPDATPYSTPNTNFGSIATTDFNLDNMIQDRSALAAYTVHFAFDSAAVKDSEQANIASVAQALSSDANAKLLIEGHCDERGTEEYNRALGERRALALREALAKNGIDPARIRTISYGKDKPADPGHDESAWTKNRRGEFILLHPKTGV